MLSIIIGRAGSGKTDYIYKKIKALMENKKCENMIIVPEQFSHEAERELCQICGASVGLYAEISSFSRLINRVLSELGGLSDKTLDGGGRILLMNLALKTSTPVLKLYNLGKRRPDFLRRLIATKDEFKTARAGYEELLNAAESQNGVFGDKLRDLANIFSAYDGLMPESVHDPYDDLDRLCQLIDMSKIGCGEIFIDGFTDFTAQQSAIIEKLMKKCENMTVCLNCDDVFGTETQFEIQRETVAKLINMSNRAGCRYEIKTLHRTGGRPEALDHLEKYLFAGSKVKYEGEDNSVALYISDTLTRECEMAAAKALRLVKESECRWRDIVVSVSDWNSYRSILPGIFEKYGVPIYTYDKEDIIQKPVFALVSSALDVISQGWEYEDVFRYLKTNLTGVSLDDRDMIENYVFKWNIRGESMWAREENWSAPVGGYSDQTGDDSQVLERINEIRKITAKPLYKLALRLKKSNIAREKVFAVYDFTEEIGLYGRIDEMTRSLAEAGQLQAAAEYSQVWEMFVSALEQCASVLGDMEIETEEFVKLFKLMLAEYEVGTIPASIDCVSVGDMTRTRRRRVKHAIILGASDDKMPAFPQSEGVLSDDERDRLAQWGIELSNTSYLRLARQMNTIYSALTQPEESLTVSFCENGGSSRPSFIFTGIGQILGVKPQYVGDDIKREAISPCFELAAAGDHEAEKFFMNRPEWRDRLSLVKNAASIPRGRLSVSSAGKLYSKDINITATRVDKYRSCKFAYFLQYGLKVKPRVKATFQAPEAGTFIHYILENVTRDVMAAGGFENTSRDEIERITEKHTRAYIESALDGFKDKSKRFVYLFGRLVKDAVSIACAMAEELSSSDFVPLDFELMFSKGGDMPPAVVTDGDSQVTVNGKVDRVDGWIHDDKLYVKVVDYKTGLKEFSLSDVLNGIGLQMLIYLFVLQKKGKIRYDAEIVPAGVLYMPAREVILSMDRNSTDGDIEKQRAKSLRRHGLLLNDGDVIEAMEHGSTPKYIPVKFNKDGDAQGDSLVDAEKFGILSRHIDSVLLDMGKSLRNGEISADPYFKNSLDNACLYCDYYEACHFGDDKADHVRYISKLRPGQVWDKMRQKEESNGR